MNRTHFLSELDTLLNASAFKDYCPNGLQIQGTASITKIATAVTASHAVIQAAAAWGADALLVHHGYFWKGEAQPLVGMKYERIATLMRHNINLVAYHLPLDAHETLGNNAQLGMKLGFVEEGQLPTQSLVWHGGSELASLGALAQHVTQVLGRAPQVVGELNAPIGLVAWCTGAAQDFITEAAAFGCDTYISGEISERTFHEARELGINYLACGHHATERYGVQALGAHISKNFGLECCFFDENNPI